MIETRNLTKTFDNFTAVDSLDLKIETGEARMMHFTLWLVSWWYNMKPRQPAS